MFGIVRWIFSFFNSSGLFTHRQEGLLLYELVDDDGTGDSDKEFLEKFGQQFSREGDESFRVKVEMLEEPNGFDTGSEGLG